MRKLFYILIVLALCFLVVTPVREVSAQYTGETPIDLGDGKWAVEFLQSGTWEVPLGMTEVDVLVVGGGGGGGSRSGGGGGGAGGVTLQTGVAVTPGAVVTITVGSGGAGASAAAAAQGSDGGGSAFGAVSVSGGGGSGAARVSTGTPSEHGRIGGSGGGGGRCDGSRSNGGAGTSEQGYAGGKGGGGPSYAGGGGGGAGGVGSDNGLALKGSGGVGVSHDIRGAARTYAVGGQGAAVNTNGSGGQGGGGSAVTDQNGTAGATNRGGGGGGGGSRPTNIFGDGGAGGSGIVIVRYAGLSVETHSATNVESTTATLHGEVLVIAGAEIVERGFVWDKISRGAPGDVAPNATAYSDYWTESGSWGTEVFSRAIVNLDEGTTYYFRAAAKNDSDVWAYGDESEFTTAQPPGVVTLSALEVKDTAATLRGQVTAVSDTNILERGFEWGTSTGVYTQEWTQLGTWGVGSFSTTLTGLSRGVTYYYRAKARNTAGWGYGSELTFGTFNPSIYAFCIDDDNSDAEIYGPNWYAQTFTPYEGFKLSAVRIKAAAVDTPGPLTVSIRETTDLGIIRTLDLVSAVYDGLGSLDWYEIPMPEYYLENKEYALVIRAVAGDAANYVEWRYASNSTCSGCYASSVNSGTSWTHNCDRSFMYEIRGHTTLKILNAQVYTGYLEEGDWLITVYYFNEYPPYYGTTVMSDYFALQLMVGGLPVVSTRLRQWGQLPGSLYIGKALAETLSWGETYQIRMIGLYDPYPFTTYTLIPPDWKGSDLKRLDNWVIETAKSISIKYETALVTVANKNEVLNELGSVLFKVGVPMLEQVRPHLFLFPDVQTPYSERKWTRAYEDSFDYTELWGDKILDDAAAVGGMVGIAGLELLRLVFFGTWAIIGVGAVAVVGTGAIFVSMPFLIIGTLSGILPITPLALVVVLIVMTLVYVIWFRGT